MAIDYDGLADSAIQYSVYFYEQALNYLANTHGMAGYELVQSAMQLSQTMASTYVGFIDGVGDEETANILAEAIKAAKERGVN